MQDKLFKIIIGLVFLCLPIYTNATIVDSPPVYEGNLYHGSYYNKGISFNGDKSIVYMGGVPQHDQIRAYSLSTPGDITTSTVLSTIDLNVTVKTMSINEEGTVLLFFGGPFSANYISQYNFGTPWDITSIYYVTRYNIGTWDGDDLNGYISNGQYIGTKQNGCYYLNTPRDLNSIVSSSNCGEGYNAMYMSDDGKHYLYQSRATLYQYYLPTPYQKDGTEELIGSTTLSNPLGYLYSDGQNIYGSKISDRWLRWYTSDIYTEYTGPTYELLTTTNTDYFNSINKLTATEQLESDINPYNEHYTYRGTGFSYDYGQGELQFTGFWYDVNGEAFYTFSGDTFYKTVWGDYIDKEDILFSGSQYLS